MGAQPKGRGRGAEAAAPGDFEEVQSRQPLDRASPTPGFPEPPAPPTPGLGTNPPPPAPCPVLASGPGVAASECVMLVTDLTLLRARFLTCKMHRGGRPLIAV